MQFRVITEAPLPYLLLEPDTAGADGQADGLPLFILMHGRGSNPDDMAGLAQALDTEHYRYVCPRAPLTISFGLLGEGYAWYEMGQQQVESIRQARQLVEALVLHLEQEFKTPRSRMVIGGFSQGALMAMEVGLRSEEPFAAIIALSGYLVPDEEMKAAVAKHKDRRLLMIHGTEDQVIWVQTARSTVESLRELGVEPTYKEYVMAHEVITEELMLLRQYLAETFAKQS